MTIVERFKQESMYGLSDKKSGPCREVAVGGGLSIFDRKRESNSVDHKNSCKTMNFRAILCLFSWFTRTQAFDETLPRFFELLTGTS